MTHDIFTTPLKSQGRLTMLAMQVQREVEGLARSWIGQESVNREGRSQRGPAMNFGECVLV